VCAALFDFLLVSQLLTPKLPDFFALSWFWEQILSYLGLSAPGGYSYIKFTPNESSFLASTN
jgi:hypothetical protein